MRNVVDIITVRALRYGLEPYAPAELVAADLAQVAGDRREPLVSALRRIDSGRLERTDQIVERARHVLERALDDVGDMPSGATLETHFSMSSSSTARCGRPSRAVSIPQGS